MTIMYSCLVCLVAMADVCSVPGPCSLYYYGSVIQHEAWCANPSVTGVSSFSSFSSGFLWVFGSFVASYEFY